MEQIESFYTKTINTIGAKATTHIQIRQNHLQLAGDAHNSAKTVRLSVSSKSGLIVAKMALTTTQLRNAKDKHSRDIQVLGDLWIEDGFRTKDVTIRSHEMNWACQTRGSG